MKYHHLFRVTEDLVVVAEIIFYNWEENVSLLVIYFLAFILGSTLQGISSFEHRFSQKKQSLLLHISYFIKAVSIWMATQKNISISLNVQLIIQFYLSKQNINEKEIPLFGLFLIFLNLFNYITILTDNYLIFAFDLIMISLDIKHLLILLQKQQLIPQYQLPGSNENTTTHQKVLQTFQFDLPSVKSTKQAPIFSGDRFTIKKLVLTHKSEIFESSIKLSDYYKKDLEAIQQNQQSYLIEKFLDLYLLYIHNDITHRILISEFITYHYEELSNIFYFSIEDNEYFNFKDIVLLIEQHKNGESEILITFSFLDVPQKYQRKQGKVKKQLFFDLCRSLPHELGSNLNSILTFSNLAAQNEGISEQIKTTYIYPILVNSLQLSLILNNVRDFAQIGLSQFNIKLEEMPIIDTVEYINSLFESALESKDIELTVRFHLKNRILITDKERFEQIYFQLLQNAIKFTQSGQIRVNVHNNTDRFIISIEDTGIGMSEEEEANLCYLLDKDEFVKVSANSVGSGMGLVISNMIVKQMNRCIPIKFQRLLIGTQFYFELPNVVKNPTYLEKKASLEYQTGYQSIKMVTTNSYIEGPLGQQSHIFSTHFSPVHLFNKKKRKETKSLSVMVQYEENLDSEEQNDSVNVKVSYLPIFVAKQRSDLMEYSLQSDCCTRCLIVDDDYYNIQCLKLIMMKYRVKCDYAYNGQDALALINKKQGIPCSICHNTNYLLIFLDINMPVMDGYQTIKELKRMMNDSTLKKAYCIANSGYCDLKTKIKCYELGMDFFMIKPLNQNLLKEILLCFFPTLENSLTTQ